MLYYTILYSTILYSTLLYYTILYYTILYYTILYYTILYYTILYYTILYYTIHFRGSGCAKVSTCSMHRPLNADCVEMGSKVISQADRYSAGQQDSAFDTFRFGTDAASSVAAAAVRSLGIVFGNDRKVAAFVPTPLLRGGGGRL